MGCLISTWEGGFGVRRIEDKKSIQKILDKGRPCPAPGGPGKCTLRQMNHSPEEEGCVHQMTHKMPHTTINKVAL